jgi:hypothetical protein
MEAMMEMMRAFASVDGYEDFVQAQGLAQKFLEAHPQ